MSVQWNPEPGETLPWWLTEELPAETGTAMVRCLAVLAAFLADELELPAGTMPALLRAAIDDYCRPDACLQSVYEAVRVAFG